MNNPPRKLVIDGVIYVLAARRRGVKMVKVVRLSDGKVTDVLPQHLNMVDSRGRKLYRKWTPQDAKRKQVAQPGAAGGGMDWWSDEPSPAEKLVHKPKAPPPAVPRQLKTPQQAKPEIPKGQKHVEHEGVLVPAQPGRKRWKLAVRNAVVHAKETFPKLAAHIKATHGFDLYTKGTLAKKMKEEWNPHAAAFKESLAQTQAMLAQHGLKMTAPPAAKSYLMWIPNPDYNPELDLSGKPCKDNMVGNAVTLDGKVHNKYTERKNGKQNLFKFEGYVDLFRQVPDFLRQAQNDIKSSDPTLNLHATAALLINDTGLRPGNPNEETEEKKADDPEAVGLTQLTRDHIKWGKDGKSFQIEYIGKHGQPHYGDDAPLVTDPVLVKRMRQLYDHAGPKDPLFKGVDRNSLAAYIGQRMVTEDGKHRGTPKTLRAYIATKMFTEMVEKNPPPKEVHGNPKLLNKWLEHNIFIHISRKMGHKVAAGKVGKDGKPRPVNSSPITRWHYINPTVQKAFYDKFKHKLPDWLLKKMGHKAEAPELEYRHPDESRSAAIKTANVFFDEHIEMPHENEIVGMPADVNHFFDILNHIHDTVSLHDYSQQNPDEVGNEQPLTDDELGVVEEE